MNFLELARKRCSIRKYLSTPIEEDKFNYILEAARMAPSAVNYQPWFFLIITEEEARRKLVECYPKEWMKPAPLFIVVCGDYSQSWKRPADNQDHLLVDGGIVTEHICLAAAEQELATCIICHFDGPLLHKQFNLPETVVPISIIPVAYPADPNLFAETPKRRKPLDEMIRKESF
ncbi:nitroreductase family protein [Parabacteroides sp. PF5-9]|uniref:nitroreductase family protein n=1 Tax=Parabacteroides sp. PF5-9 TaxID=1742404 RepID=UPI0024731747|nr:nitroreductase family protein [Parabacteroides sp. PF5-9]MDH6356802.1 nitroreductase [Parabacteroides sp. PF5-9]